MQFASGTLLLLTDVIPNLPLTGGTLTLGPAFQGGTITNLTISGSTLAGTNVVTGLLNFGNGVISGGSLTIASNGVMNINASSQLLLECPLTNFGTVTWTNVGSIDVANGAGIYFGLIENLGLFDVQSDTGMMNNVIGSAYFHNAGTLQKSSRSGSSGISIPLYNSGGVTALQGTLSFSGGGPLTGTFTAAGGAAITFSGGNFSNSVPVSINGPGAVQLTGGNLLLLTDVIPKLGLTGGTVTPGPAFQGGAITNLTIAGATLAGTNTVTGTFNWLNGSISAGSLTVASNGLMNISATGQLTLNTPLTNAGTVTLSNLISLDVANGSGLYFGQIENLAGALFDIQSDIGLYNNAAGPAYFHNAGTLRKSSKTGISDISIPVTNSGTVIVVEGNVVFDDGFTPVGGFLLFGLSSAASFGTARISGSATLGGTVGVVFENGFVPASGNSFTLLSYGSYTGIFTNLSLPLSSAVWLTNYGPTSFTLSVSNVDKLAFTLPPAGGKVTNAVIAPVVLQVEDPSNNLVPLNGVPVTVSLNSGTGSINGTLTQSTDATGKATFGDLSFTAVGTKSLKASSAQLTGTTSASFFIVPMITQQSVSNGFLIQLNGSYSLGPVIISASTDLVSWLPIYTNAPTNGPIQFLDTSATNYPDRFYHIVEQ